MYVCVCVHKCTGMSILLSHLLPNIKSSKLAGFCVFVSCVYLYCFVLFGCYRYFGVFFTLLSSTNHMFYKNQFIDNFPFLNSYIVLHCMDIGGDICISSHLLSKTLTALCSRLSFQSYLYSQQS